MHVQAIYRYLWIHMFCIFGHHFLSFCRSRDICDFPPSCLSNLWNLSRSRSIDKHQETVSSSTSRWRHFPTCADETILWAGRRWTKGTAGDNKETDSVLEVEDVVEHRYLTQRSWLRIGFVVVTSRWVCSLTYCPYLQLASKVLAEAACDVRQLVKKVEHRADTSSRSR